MSGQQFYVVGFLLDDRDRVVLIAKNRPGWMKGLRNGVGGKVEDGESVASAMRREFREETGLVVTDWHCFLTYYYADGIIWFYRAFVSADVLDQVTTTTDELVEIWQLGDLLQPGTPIVANLRWLVPLAAHRKDRYQGMSAVEVGA